MTPGYDKPLYILAFDHRTSFERKLFGIEGTPDAGGPAAARRGQARSSSTACSPPRTPRRRAPSAR